MSSAKRSRVVLIVTIVLAAVLLPFVDRYVSSRFINPSPANPAGQPAAPDSKVWDLRNR
jgi:hypothetical protein